MKKTININLGGYPFTIDEDAYNLLKDYLDTIRYAFNSADDTEELANDIELRVAELLYEANQNGNRIVTIEQISKVIERIGAPAEIVEIEETVSRDGDKTQTQEEIKVEVPPTPPPFVPNNATYSRNPFARKKIFRDPQNAMLGGVCSGLAQYLHIDVTIIRLVVVLLFFLSGTTVAIIYIILWIVVPEARTPYQRMLMTGTDPTMENIGKTVTDSFSEAKPFPVDDDKRNGFSRFISTVLTVVAKCLVVLCLIIGIPILLALFLVMLACIIAFFVTGPALLGYISLGDGMVVTDPTDSVAAFYLLMATLGAVITLAIPLYLFARKAFRKNSYNLSPATRRSLLIIWLAGLALTAVFTVKTVRKVNQMAQIENSSRKQVTIDKEGIEINNGQGQEISIREEGIKVINNGDTITANSVIKSETPETPEIPETKTDSI